MVKKKKKKKTHLPVQIDIRDVDLIPGSEKCPREGHGNPLQYSCLANPMGRGAWWASVRGVAQSWTRLSNGTCTQGASKINNKAKRREN